MNLNIEIFIGNKNIKNTFFIWRIAPGNKVVFVTDHRPINFIPMRNSNIVPC